MKKSIIFFTGAFLGYAVNTETGKKLCNWVYSKTQEQINVLIGKINEVTETDSPSPESPKEEGK